jgi:hypothetical protein
VGKKRFAKNIDRHVAGRAVAVPAHLEALLEHLHDVRAPRIAAHLGTRGGVTEDDIVLRSSLEKELAHRGGRRNKGQSVTKVLCRRQRDRLRAVKADGLVSTESESWIAFLGEAEPVLLGGGGVYSV